jgi:hypothetical protein
MTLEEQLQDAYQRAAERAPVSTGAYDRFLRRRARRGRVVAATAGLALVAVLGAAVLVARQLPQERGPVAPAGEVVRVPEQGFELPVPAGWRVQRQLTGPGSQVVGVVLVPRSEELRGAAITVVADDDQPPHYILNLQIGARRRADGRLYRERPAPNPGSGPQLGKGAVGQYVIAWPAWPPSCRPLPVPAGQPPACARAAWRVLLVSGAAAPGDTASACWRPGRSPGCEQVQQVMHRILASVRPVGDALPPPGGPPHQGAAGQGRQRPRRLGGLDRAEHRADPGQQRQRRVHAALPPGHAHAGIPLGAAGAVGDPARRRLHPEGLPVVAARLRAAAVGGGPRGRGQRPDRAGRPAPGRGGDLRPRPARPLGGLRVPTPARRHQAGPGGRGRALDAAGKTVGTQQRPFGLPWSPPSCRPRAG